MILWISIMDMAI